ncbi:polycomb protein Pcl-like [Littorina saxatilis]|uniref:polycomb protein Pcl-like n=1 Tax=Littorina saxatilis TaxID=31220 RepID=UPI0038B62351
MEGQGSGSRQAGIAQGGSVKMPHPTVGGVIAKGRGRPKKLSFSPAACRKLGVGLDIGRSVVVRWSDGLFYLGEVLRIDDANDRCQIRFDDGATFYVLFKDIHKTPGHGESSCCVCKGESSSAPNTIVTCDGCGMGFHQCCHSPPLLISNLQSHGKFFCRLCTFATRIKHGGSAKFTLPVATRDDLKQILPYKMNILTWDAQHRTNVEQSYCYCGGPGDWYSKMLQCCRCRQWFHEACVLCLQYPLLYGDRFFMFVCSHCNQGQEYIKRLPFKWVDVAHLALFNMTLCNTLKYYDLDEVLMPWIAQHADNMSIDNLLDGKSVRSAEVRDRVEAALAGHKSKFTSGREVKKKYSLWALILRIPPNAPSVVVPLSGPINADVLSNPNIKGRKTKQVFPAQCQSPIPLKYPSRSSLDQSLSIMFQNSSTRKVFPETNNNGLTNGFNGSHCYNGHSGLNGASRSNGHNSVHYSSGSESDGEEDHIPARKRKVAHRNSLRSSQSMLDVVQCKVEELSPAINSPPKTSPQPVAIKSHKPSTSVLARLIPNPLNFEGVNHPFRTELEKETEKKRVKHFEMRVVSLKKEYAGELEAFKLAQATRRNNSASPVLREKLTPTKASPEQKHRKGVKQKRSANLEKDLADEDSVRRSKRKRLSAEKYQHLLDSFPRHLPKPDPSEVAATRWKWLSVVDQLRYGEKFEIVARREASDGSLHFLLDWEDDEELSQ